ncbi:MAG: acyltransferase domain-containing protein [Candidatus Riflebacteria bacterium]|nr:acyltransferase domain-containing protein [Candidatus Riflebacteria bacterium]
MTDRPTSPFQCFVCTPASSEHAGTALAAVRAGAAGLLDLAFCQESDAGRVMANADALLAGSGSHHLPGLRLGPAEMPWAKAVLERFAHRPHVMVLCGDRPQVLVPLALLLRHASCTQIWVEVTSSEGLYLASAPDAGLAGFIACGNECGGWTGEFSAFVLTQKLLAMEGFPVMVRGVAGVHTAAACLAAGAAGVVLDDALLLLDESPVPLSWRRHLERISSQDSIALGAHTGAPCRVLALPTFPAVRRLQRIARELETRSEENDSPLPAAPARRKRAPSRTSRYDDAVSWAREVGESLKWAPEDPADRWRSETRPLVGWGDPQERAWPLGQAAGLATSCRARYGSVARMVRAVLRDSAAQVVAAAESRVLAPESPLARRHGTRHPIVQGAMTRVSDCPRFALEVAQAGGLPMLALAMSSGDSARDLLDRTSALLGDRPWGVGLLGFLEPAMREPQIREVLRVRPRFALVAGGRPDHAAQLEAAGITTYLHVPAPTLLRSFLAQGARRFVLEGRECGGHVGPLSSFILWEQAVEVLLEALAKDESASILFAGGIHDARSAAMVSALSVRLAQRGVEVGVLMGTAYLFTTEAVQSGAIVPAFQQQAIRCRETVLLESGVGHANRCATTPFAGHFQAARSRMLREGLPPEEMAKRLDEMIMGRLRVATRGLKRDDQGSLVEVDAADQEAGGMYMLGEVAAMRGQTLSMAELHDEVALGSVRRLLELPTTPLHRATATPTTCDVAIVGIGLRLPGAQTSDGYWNNILQRRCSITEIPADRWDWRPYFDPDRHSRDRIYSRWGGWIEDVVFDPLKFGIPPNRWDSINSAQLLSLEVARQALEDAGYEHRDFDRSRTSTIVAGGDIGFLGGFLVFRSFVPMLLGGSSDDLLDRLPSWTEDSFPGVLSSIVSGRLANRFDLGGSNFIVDSACASSFTAVDVACHELTSRRADTVLAGSVDVGQMPFDFTAFSRVQALSPTGRLRPFDQEADGIVISEGVAFMVLKRLADAERDGDRVYAVIRSIGTSSDGRSMGLTAPNSDGQRLAFERAYERAGIDPSTIGLYEAHGTGTPVGDRTELETVSVVLRDACPESCALGSVKSLVGHTKRTAGFASLTKVALALYHQVQPPHLGVEKPLEPLRDARCPLYLLNDARPWLRETDGPRRAGISAFGFGGTNAHLVVEEHAAAVPHEPGASQWPCELVFLGETGVLTLLEEVKELRAQIQGRIFRLTDLACSLALRTEQKPPAGQCAALVVRDPEELRDGLSCLQAHLEGGPEPLPDWILVARREGVRPGRIAFLFPGQGALYTDPCREAMLYFSELRSSLEQADRFLRPRYGLPLGRMAYPPAAFSPEQERAARQRLLKTHVAQPVIGALSSGFASLARRLGLHPDCVGGHSYGEFSALAAAGVLSTDDFLTLSEARGRAMHEAGSRGDAGTMAAISASRDQVETLLASLAPAADGSGRPAVVVANCNAPSQTVISGSTESVQRCVDALRQAGLSAVSLPVSGAFHSPLMQAAQVPLAQVMRGLSLASPKLPVYSNLTGYPYPDDPAAILEHMQNHLLGSVEFVLQVRRMSADGVRTFIEMGPGSILTGLVGEILAGTDPLAVALDTRGAGLRGLLLALGKLRCAGVPWQPAALFEKRPVRPLDLRALPTAPGIPRAAWIVNPLHTRPAEPSANPARGTSAALSAPSTLPAVPAQPRPAVPATPQRPEAPCQVSMPPPEGPPGPLPEPPTPSPAGAVALDARVLAAYQAYQETMRQFLRTQEQVMACFLNGTDVPPPAARPEPGPASPAPEPRQEPAAPPVPPVPAPAPAEPAGNGGPLDRQGVVRALVRIVAERTGYPADMLGLELDVEAQLGWKRSWASTPSSAWRSPRSSSSWARWTWRRRFAAGWTSSYGCARSSRSPMPSGRSGISRRLRRPLRARRRVSNRPSPTRARGASVRPHRGGRRTLRPRARAGCCGQRPGAPRKAPAGFHHADSISSPKTDWAWRRRWRTIWRGWVWRARSSPRTTNGSRPCWHGTPGSGASCIWRRSPTCLAPRLWRSGAPRANGRSCSSTGC